MKSSWCNGVNRGSCRDTLLSSIINSFRMIQGPWRGSSSPPLILSNPELLRYSNLNNTRGVRAQRTGTGVWYYFTNLENVFGKRIILPVGSDQRFRTYLPFTLLTSLWFLVSSLKHHFFCSVFWLSLYSCLLRNIPFLCISTSVRLILSSSTFHFLSTDPHTDQV